LDGQPAQRWIAVTYRKLSRGKTLPLGSIPSRAIISNSWVGRSSCIAAYNEHLSRPSKLADCPLRDDARALRRRVNHSSTLARHNTDLLLCRARAGQRFSSCELHSATVLEFDITPDKWSAAFKHIFCAIGKARWQARVIEHSYALPLVAALAYFYCSAPQCSFSYYDKM
jgi:hypothetical protein